MGVLELSIDNLDDYEEYIGPDAAEDIGRECCGGLAAFDDLDGDVKAALIWETHGAGSSSGVKSEISLFLSDNKFYGKSILNTYGGALDDTIGESYFELAALDKESSQVLSEAGFSLQKGESIDLRVTVGEMMSLKLAKGKVPRYIMPISKLTPKQYWQGITNGMFEGKGGLIDDLDSLPESFFDQDLSCFVESDNKVTGMLLVRRKPSSLLVPTLFYSSGPDSKINLMMMLRYFAQAANDKYNNDTEIILRRADEKTRALTAYLFPDIKGREVTIGRRKENGNG